MKRATRSQQVAAFKIMLFLFDMIETAKMAIAFEASAIPRKHTRAAREHFLRIYRKA